MPPTRRRWMPAPRTTALRASEPATIRATTPRTSTIPTVTASSLSIRIGSIPAHKYRDLFGKRPRWRTPAARCRGASLEEHPAGGRGLRLRLHGRRGRDLADALEERRHERKHHDVDVVQVQRLSAIS